MAVCLFDLDNLKKANDTCGHETGDNMLKEFAELLCQQTRTTDIRCRYGGDEFVVILKNLKDVNDVAKKVGEICKSFTEKSETEHFQAGCSAGVALCMEGEVPSSVLIARADRALYRAKRENKGGCCLWRQ